jgi:hypothetical protein
VYLIEDRRLLKKGNSGVKGAVRVLAGSKGDLRVGLLDSFNTLKSLCRGKWQWLEGQG